MAKLSDLLGRKGDNEGRSCGPKFSFSEQQPRPATTGANPGRTTLGAKPATRWENPPKQSK